MERTVKERDRMVEKYKGLCVSKDKEIEALKGRLGERKRVACPRTPSEDVEGGVEGGGPSAGTTAAAAAAGMGKKKKKRKGEGVEGNVVGRHLEVLEEMMEAVLMGGSRVIGGFMRRRGSMCGSCQWTQTLWRRPRSS